MGRPAALGRQRSSSVTSVKYADDFEDEDGEDNEEYSQDFEKDISMASSSMRRGRRSDRDMDESVSVSMSQSFSRSRSVSPSQPASSSNLQSQQELDHSNLHDSTAGKNAKNSSVSSLTWKVCPFSWEELPPRQSESACNVSSTYC